MINTLVESVEAVTVVDIDGCEDKPLDFNGEFSCRVLGLSCSRLVLASSNLASRCQSLLILEAARNGQPFEWQDAKVRRIPVVAPLYSNPDVASPDKLCLPHTLEAVLPVEDNLTTASSEQCTFIACSHMTAQNVTVQSAPLRVIVFRACTTCTSRARCAAQFATVSRRSFHR